MVIKLLLPRVPENAKATRKGWIDAFNATAEKNNKIVKAMSVWKNPNKRRLTYRLARLQNFQRVTVADLQVGKVHHGHVLYCRIATTVMIQDAKSVLIEDESGICELAVYYLRKKKLRRGEFVAILEPFFKQRLDGTLRVQVDDPCDVVHDLDPPFALLEGLATIYQQEAESEVRLKEPIAVEQSAETTGEDGTTFFDVEAQRAEPASSAPEEKKEVEASDVSTLESKDDITVNYGNQDDTILLIAKPAPIGMPTIREEEEEDDKDFPEISYDSGIKVEEIVEMQQSNAKMCTDTPQPIAPIPVDASSFEHIPLLIQAMNRLISNQKLLMDAVMGKGQNQ